jgi:3-dehydroquinate synthase
VESVIITDKINTELQLFFHSNSHSRIAILVDQNSKKYCYPILKNLPNHVVIEIKDGEENKTIETCAKIWSSLTDLKFDRKDLLINLGGGVIGDMGGFCARTYKRGIDFINIPTTLLSQVDASIGGKLGIDFQGFKNHIGLFSNPDLVIIDPIFLKTLPNEQLKSGYAEVIKHHLIADHDGWSKLKSSDWHLSNWKNIIEHSIDIKKSIVRKDPTEKNERKLLNFGHTIGHAVETYMLNTNSPLLHGEAIAIGMICESHVAYQKNMIEMNILIQITDFIKKVYEKVSLTKSMENQLFETMLQDKKNNNDTIMAVLIDEIGSARWDCEINKIEIINSLEYYNQT